MEIKKLQCDVCGGRILIQPGGQFGECESCGANYTIERMREIYSGIKVSVTGTDADVKQWKMLLNKYMECHDYQSALPVVRKVLEAVPTDEEANQIYDTLQELQYFDIRNGVLIKYTGNAKIINFPEGVQSIAEGAFVKGPFSFVTCEQINLPDSLIELMEWPECEKLIVPENVKKIGGDKIFCTRGLKHLVIPSRFTELLRFITSCNKLETICASNKLIEQMINYAVSHQDYSGIWHSPWFLELKTRGLCPYCGGTLKGVYNRKCKICGKKYPFY